MRRFTALTLTALLSVSLSGCTEGDDAPVAAQPNAAGGANVANGAAPQAPNGANGTGAATNARPGTAAQLPGTWNYIAILVNQNGQQQEVPATGTLVLKADNTWTENLSVNGQPATQTQGTYSVQGDQVTVKQDNGQQIVATFQIGEAEAPNGGGKKPALILKSAGENGATFTFILTR